MFLMKTLKIVIITKILRMSAHQVSISRQCNQKLSGFLLYQVKLVVFIQPEYRLLLPQN